MNPAVSIVCPIYNEERYISDCIFSLLRQDYPHDRVELLLVDGLSEDRTRHIIKDIIERGVSDIDIRLFDNRRRSAAAGMNIGIENARGEYIIRVDAHAVYPDNYITRLICEIHEGLSSENDGIVENVGGICRTLPGADTAKAKGIATAISTRFGMGTSYFRVGTKRKRYVDTVPFGCFRKNLFDRIGLFDEELLRNQDDEFNGRIIRSGGRILLLPDLIIDYFGRSDFKSTWRMFYQYGFFKPKVSKRLGKPTTFRQFVPPIFVLTIFISFIIGLFYPIVLMLFIAVLLLWLIIALCSAASRNGLSVVSMCTVGAYAIVHFAYGTGYIIGLLINKQEMKNER